MRFLITPLLAFSLVSVAQTPPAAIPPAKVDRALRARVTEFEQDQVEGNFRKAYELVSKESQDYFFSTAKEKPKSFKIEDIQYSDHFSKAAVKISTTRKMLVASYTIDVPNLVVDRWKLVGGKWMWYHDPALETGNLFGLPIGPVGEPTGVKPKAVPTDTSPEAVAAAAKEALKPADNRPPLQQASVEFVSGKPGVQEITFHNTYSGQIRIDTSIAGNAAGLSVEKSQSMVDALGDTVVRVHYEPGEVAPSASLVIEVQPFRRTYSLPIHVTAVGPQ